MMKAAPRIADELAEHLRDRIIRGMIPPGAQLAEASLAAEYDVSRPTVRTAIDLLIADGLITRKPHLPPQVAKVSERDLREIVGLLEICENIALQEFFASEADSRPLRRAVKESANQTLHTLVKSTGSERLTLIHRRCTFELMLGQRQSWSASEKDLRSFADAVATYRLDGAQDALAALQTARRAGVSFRGSAEEFLSSTETVKIG